MSDWDSADLRERMQLREDRPLLPHEVMALKADNQRLRALIAQAEYRGGVCPWCPATDDNQVFGEQPGTHHPDCPAFSAPGVVR